MSDSFAGITVPDGDPGALESAAAQFGTVASTLSGVSGDLRGMPGSLASWSGPASVAYAGSCLTNGSACDTAVQALGSAEHAARAYGHELEAAQTAARHAIRDARDAQDRIDRAERDIASAQARQRDAATAESNAGTQLAVSSAAGLPDPVAEAAQTQARTDAANAAADEAAARRELDRARHDLEVAKQHGHQAMEDARDAARAAGSAFAAAAGVSPAYALPGAPGQGTPGSPGFWDTTNEGAQWWDEDQFLAQLFPWHPKNDDVGHYKWWGDQALGVASDWGSGAAVGYGAALRRAAIRDMDTLTLGYARRFVAGPGGTVLTESWTATAGRTTVIDASLLAKAGQYGKVGKAIPIVGGAVAIGSAGWDQWRDDSSNPNLTTTDRVGRATGVGVYVGGASIAGAAIGTAIFPGVGTVAGLAIGATAGLVAGAVASSITPVKEAMASAGQWTANATVDAVNWTGDRLSDGAGAVKDGIEKGADFVRDHMPDIDLPDLNPF
jgi:hypothetical protein